MRINRADTTLRNSWYHTPIAVPADDDWSDPDRDVGSVESDGSRGGFQYGYLNESPERPGPRFHTPTWVSNIRLFRKYGCALLKSRVKKFPSLADFQRVKSEVDVAILWEYFLDHASYQEIFDKFGCNQNPAYGVCEVSTSEAASVGDAIELAAKRNGTFAFFDESKDCYVFMDQTVEPLKAFRRVVGRKVNAKIFRVNFDCDSEEKYRLAAKLDPQKCGSTRRMQRYIFDLIDEGYRLLKIAKPDEANRIASRKRRQAEEESGITRAQYGAGTNPKQYENVVMKSFKASQAMQEHIELLRLAALERRFSTPVSEEEVYLDLMRRTGVDRAIQQLPWQPPAEPTKVVDFKPIPVVSPDILRMSIQVLLASLSQDQPALHPLAA